MKKTMNKFDYPTAASHTYKMYHPSNDRGPQSESQRQKFKEIVKREKDIQRQRVKEEQNRKRKIQEQQHKQKIQMELLEKKRELEELERAKKEAYEQQKRSQELALIKIEENKKKKVQQQQKMKQNQYKAQNRFVQALQRMQIQKQEKAYKQKQAQHRRKVNEQNERVQREKAIKYREYIQEKQRTAEEPQKRTFDAFKKPLGRTAYGTIDYTKTRLHNPQIILRGQEQKNAIQLAEEVERKRKQISQQKKRKEEQNMRRSFERGQEAIEKIKRKKQYQKYERQTDEANKKYNYSRIQAGKKDQFIGIKPSTLAQMEANKKLRGEEQFQKMFLKSSNPQVFNRPATKYEIFQAKLKEDESYEEPQYCHIPNQSCSNEAAISTGKYSFQSEGIEDLTTVKKDNPYEMHKVEEVQEPQESVRQMSRQSPEMNVVQEYENRRKNKPDELSYSQSEEDSNV